MCQVFVPTTHRTVYFCNFSPWGECQVHSRCVVIFTNWPSVLCTAKSSKMQAVVELRGNTDSRGWQLGGAWKLGCILCSTLRMSRDEQRATDAPMEYWRDCAARHRLNPLGRDGRALYTPVGMSGQDPS